MKILRVIAGAAIRRGDFCAERPGGAYSPQADWRGAGGVAQRGYGAWPPEPIADGEEFDLVVDGGCMGLIGDRAIWVELRDGRLRVNDIDPGYQGELRSALFVVRGGNTD